MKYLSGDIVHIGDKVKFEGNLIGIVVCSIDNSEYSEKYTEKDWSYLNKGVLIETDEIGLVHLEENDVNLILIARKL